MTLRFSNVRCSPLMITAVLLLQVGSCLAKTGSVRKMEAPGHRDTLPDDSYAQWSRQKTQNLRLQVVRPCRHGDVDCPTGTFCHRPKTPSAHCLRCRKTTQRCHGDSMCCPGNRCLKHVCVATSNGTLPLNGFPEEERKNLPTEVYGLKKSQKARTEMPMKGHEGDPCLRTSDCTEGFCCARHFWTRICKPVLQTGQQCTRQRHKNNRGLEVFQRCNCAKGLLCKVWTDASATSKSRLHICQGLPL